MKGFREGVQKGVQTPFLGVRGLAPGAPPSDPREGLTSVGRVLRTLPL